jgi:hypothetical protein
VSPKSVLHPPKPFKDKTAFGTSIFFFFCLKFYFSCSSPFLLLFLSLIEFNLLLLLFLEVSVALFASNCKAAGASERTNYIEELMKLMKVN